MPGYNIEHTPTESSNGRTLLYIKQGINYKLQKDLQIYKSKKLESTFVEVLEPGMSKNNMMIGCIYHHPSMELSEFNNHFLSVLLEKISKENKMVVLLGDFNADQNMIMMKKYQVSLMQCIPNYYYLISLAQHESCQLLQP